MNKIEKVFIENEEQIRNVGIKVVQGIDLASWIWHPNCEREDTVFLKFEIEFNALDDPLVIH